MNEFERFVYWMVYAGALKAKQHRKHKDVCARLEWRQSLAKAAQELGTLGMVL